MSGESADHPRTLATRGSLARWLGEVGRIDEAISAVQSFVRRARLGLEPGWKVGREFACLWEGRFETYEAWERCKRREIYKENWIQWSELEKARRIEAFRFLETKLHSSTLTLAAPGGADWWPDEASSLEHAPELLQRRVPSELHALTAPPQAATREGLGTLGSPEYIDADQVERLRAASRVPRERIRCDHAGGAVRFRVTLPPHAVAALTLEGRVTELAGIGATLEQKIRDLLSSGEIAQPGGFAQTFRGKNHMAGDAEQSIVFDRRPVAIEHHGGRRRRQRIRLELEPRPDNRIVRIKRDVEINRLHQPVRRAIIGETDGNSLLGAHVSSN